MANLIYMDGENTKQMRILRKRKAECEILYACVCMVVSEGKLPVTFELCISVNSNA